MSTGKPAHTADSFRLAEVMRIAGAVAVAGLALGYLLADYDGDTLNSLARVFGAAALVIVVLWVKDARQRRQLDRIETLLDERLERHRRWGAYADVLNDLGGIDGESSGDISMPRR